MAALAMGIAVAGLAACQPVTVNPNVDTFTTSTDPTGTRDTMDTMLVMNSAGKLKIGLVSFDVPDAGSTVSGTLKLYTKQAGFNLDVKTVPAFTASVTHNTRPTLGASVGTLSSTTANAVQSIPITNAPVSGGKVYLAITTTSLYELEVVSNEGAATAGQPTQAPSFTYTPPAVSIQDTFTTSTDPTGTRDTMDTMLVMNSAGKLKIGLLSFTVPSGWSTASGTLKLYTKQAGFNLAVKSSAPFTAATVTHNTRPTLGATVGSLSSTTANAVQSIAIDDAPVSGGKVYLAVTTTSLYELEVVSTEGAVTAGQPSQSPSFDTDATWSLTWEDQFNGSSVDTSKWTVYDQNGGWHSVESPKSTTCPKSSNVTVGSGKLVMTTRKANGTCNGGQAQSGAGMNTIGKFSQAQGKFVARARWTHSGNYLWGGFWTHSNNIPNYNSANASELDIFEYIGKDAAPNINRYKPAIHYNYTCDGICGTQNVVYSPYDVTQWHDYAVEWGPTNPSDPMTTVIVFSIDGKPNAMFDRYGSYSVAADGTRTQIQSTPWGNTAFGAFPNPFGPNRPHSIVLSAWVGAPGVADSVVNAGFNPSGGTASLEVDWIEVYEKA